VEILAGLAVELGLLTQAIDTPGTDVAETLTQLAASARSTIESYLGLSMALTVDGNRFDIPVLNEHAQADDIHSSLLVPLSPQIVAGTPDVPSIALILYAGTAGAFTDLAADLAWLSGRALVEYRLDEHCALPLAASAPSPLGTLFTVNQAIGVLIGQGFEPADAEQELNARAAKAGIDRESAATVILDSLQSSGAEFEALDVQGLEPPDADMDR
jgi:hypothetical protein